MLKDIILSLLNALSCAHWCTTFYYVKYTCTIGLLFNGKQSAVKVYFFIIPTVFLTVHFLFCKENDELKILGLRSIIKM